MKKLAEMFRHNQGIAIAIVIVIAVLFWTYGCDSKVTSITKPNTKVTRAELKIEIDAFLAMAEVRYADLDKQDEFKQKLFEYGALFVEGGTLNPVGIVATMGTLLGIGAFADNRIKDKVIKNRPLKTTTG